MDLSGLQFNIEQMMGLRAPPHSQALPGNLPGTTGAGAMLPGNVRLPTSVATAGMGTTPARMAVLPGTSAGAAASASYGKGPSAKKQKL